MTTSLLLFVVVVCLLIVVSSKLEKRSGSLPGSQYTSKSTTPVPDEESSQGTRGSQPSGQAEERGQSSRTEEEKEGEEGDDSEGRLVPQLTIGEDGSIVIDEKR